MVFSSLECPARRLRPVEIFIKPLGKHESLPRKLVLVEDEESSRRNPLKGKGIILRKLSSCESHLEYILDSVNVCHRFQNATSSTILDDLSIPFASRLPRSLFVRNSNLKIIHLDQTEFLQIVPRWNDPNFYVDGQKKEGERVEVVFLQISAIIDTISIPRNKFELPIFTSFHNGVPQFDSFHDKNTAA